MIAVRDDWVGGLSRSILRSRVEPDWLARNMSDPALSSVKQMNHTQMILGEVDCALGLDRIRRHPAGAVDFFEPCRASRTQATHTKIRIPQDQFLTRTLGDSIRRIVDSFSPGKCANYFAEGYDPN